MTSGSIDLQALRARLVEFDPYNGLYHCLFCKMSAMLPHAETCLWLQLDAVLASLGERRGTQEEEHD